VQLVFEIFNIGPFLAYLHKMFCGASEGREGRPVRMFIIMGGGGGVGWGGGWGVGGGGGGGGGLEGRSQKGMHPIWGLVIVERGVF
jgi:hypothetical protein